MQTPDKNPNEYLMLAREHVAMADQISRRLFRRYNWVGLDDLHSYAYLGLTLAARVFDPSRGVPFDRFASTKAMFLAIDEMRKDGILRRADSTVRTIDMAGVDIETPDPSSNQALKMLETREFCSKILRQINKQDRELLLMIYAERMTYKEISGVYHISESAVCLRHKSVMQRLRKNKTVRQAA
ncbi:MAG: sigma-70 family RNA polymerase sigma factor [Phycisphaerae bacterium]|nr:sigma-70 family RNA polymerase sigma factor [Phycisphaerae bacterium]